MPYSAAIRKQRISPIDCASNPPNLLHAGAYLFLARFAQLHWEPALRVYDLPYHPLGLVGTRHPSRRAMFSGRPQPPAGAIPAGRGPRHVKMGGRWDMFPLRERFEEYCVELEISVWCIRSENW